MEIEKCFKRLLIKSPFYGLFCLSLPKNITRKIPTLCISKKGINCQLNINPDFWEQHTDDEQLSLLQHELSHIALQHIFISESFADRQMFNIAADVEVNSYLENLPASAMTASALAKEMGLSSLETGLGTKKYYELIQQYLKQQQSQAQSPSMPCNGGQGGSSSQQSSQSSSSSSSEVIQEDSQENNQPSQSKPQEEDKPQEKEEQKPPLSPKEEPKEQQQKEEEKKEEQQYPDEFKNFKPLDDHSSWKDFKDMPEANKQLMVNNVNALLKATAEQVEKMRGTIPGELTEIISKLREKKPEIFNWKAYFRRLLGSIYDVNIKSTRRKESKRFEGAMGIQHKKKVSILVAVDTSGSVSTKELQDFFSEIDYIYKAGARATILECDTRINKIVEYDGKHIPEIKGRGGTDWNPPIEYYIDHKKEYASLVYFTDGECSLPTKRPSGVVWVITSNGYRQEYFGKTIFIPKEY